MTTAARRVVRRGTDPARASAAAAVLPAARVLTGAAAPVREAEPDVDEQTEEDLPWEVVVWDDPVNLMSYVVHVFRKVLGVSEDEATQLMLEVHHEGSSLVATEPRSTAERYLREFHRHGLQATLRRSA